MVVGCAAREKVRWWQWSVRIAPLNVLKLFVWKYNVGEGEEGGEEEGGEAKAWREKTTRLSPPISPNKRRQHQPHQPPPSCTSEHGGLFGAYYLHAAMRKG